MTEIRDAAINFEAVKISLKQDKTGIILTLAIHPNEVPPSLFTDWVGSRYVAALVKLDDEDKPVEPADAMEGRKAVQVAGALCKRPEFQNWLVGQGIIFDASEEDAAGAVCDIVGISSRAELKTNAAARKQFYEIVDKFKGGYK
jgi:hypothetical protein